MHSFLFFVGAPFVMSYAHFLDASPDYQQAVTGMKPDKNIHQTEVTVEPVEIMQT